MRHVKRMVIVLLVLGLYACGASAPDHGIVRDKRYVPAHYDNWSTMECQIHDSKGNCLAYIPVRHSSYVADKQLHTRNNKEMK